MTPPPNPQAQCAGKVTWPTKAAALKHRRRLLQRGRERHTCHKEKARSAAALEPYRCSCCHQWHLGNPSMGKVAK